MKSRTRVIDPSAFGKVAVLMGGWSSERQVSLWSGKAVLEALRDRGVDAHGVDFTPSKLFNLKRRGFDRVFNLLHGAGGEDGRAQAVLDLLGLPYTGSGVLACALAMDKLRSKGIWKSEGLPTPEWRELASADDAFAAAKDFGYPFFIKPSEEGSSVGVSKVRRRDEVLPAFESARGDAAVARVVMAERFVGGGEYTCALLGREALPTIRIEPDGEFYDYNAKYLSDDTRYHCPSGLTQRQEAEFRALCLRAFDLLGARGWGRVDFLLDEKQRPWLLEANLVPGMTSHSLVPVAARAAGIAFDELCWRILLPTLEPFVEISDARAEP